VEVSSGPGKESGKEKLKVRQLSRIRPIEGLRLQGQTGLETV